MYDHNIIVCDYVQDRDDPSCNYESRIDPDDFGGVYSYRAALGGGRHVIDEDLEQIQADAIVRAATTREGVPA